MFGNPGSSRKNSKKTEMYKNLTVVFSPNRVCSFETTIERMVFRKNIEITKKLKYEKKMENLFLKT